MHCRGLHAGSLEVEAEESEDARMLYCDILRSQFNYRMPPQSAFSCQFIRSGPVGQVVVLHVFYSSVYTFTFLVVPKD